jgi:hypothetical protein
MGPFFIGFLPVGVLAGFRATVLVVCEGGSGKLGTSIELCDSVDLRFFDRVGAMFELGCGYNILAFSGQLNIYRV